MMRIIKMGDIPEGDFTPGFNFYIKNIDTAAVTDAMITPVDNEDVIETTLQVGWNPELCSSVTDAPAGKLQWGIIVND